VEGPVGDAQGKTVLVVDDEPNLRLFLQTALEDAGFAVMTAANANQALEQMAETKPDVISLDLVMPRMSGLKFYQHIQRDPDRAEIPVVVVTAHSQDEMGSDDFQKFERYRSKGARLSVLEKPVDAPTYVAAIRKAAGLEPLSPGEAGLRTEVADAIRSASLDTLKEALRVLKG
jgi:CheY-like chemotaxis protein